MVTSCAHARSLIQPTETLRFAARFHKKLSRRCILQALPMVS
uniref:Uncharacterized protein n=1 Tax=Arundo donax TaxID=35708 RepID=A0A0A9FXL8_ARUDO